LPREINTVKGSNFARVRDKARSPAEQVGTPTYETVIVVTMENTVFWDITPYSLVEVYGHFVGTC
jgi:hypothetical protein